MFGSPRPSTSSRPPPSRTSSLPEPLLSPSLEHPTQSRSPLRKTASDTSALSTPAKRSDDANRILCKNTPAHLRLARRSPDVSRALPDTFYPGMEETFPASEHHPPTQYDVASPSSPSASTPWHLVQHHAFSTAPPLPEFPDSHVEEQSVASHSPLPLKTVERERSSTPEAVVEETQAVGMPPPPLTTVESVPFPEVEQAFRGALGSTSTADENVTTYSQSRLENFFIARNQPPQEDAALQAIQRHIEHQKHIRSQDFMDASHQLDEDVLPSSQSQPEDITVLNQDQDVIPETQAAFEVI